MNPDDEATIAAIEASQMLLLDILVECLESQWNQQGLASEPLEDALTKFVGDQAFAVGYPSSLFCSDCFVVCEYLQQGLFFFFLHLSPSVSIFRGSFFPGLCLQLISFYTDTSKGDGPSNAHALVNQAGRMLCCLTSRNFKPIYDTVIAKCKQLAGPEEVTDTGELALLPYLHFNRPRLVTLLQDASTQCRYMKKQAQIAMANYLYTVVWNWISGRCKMIAWHWTVNPQGAGANTNVCQLIP